MKGPNEEDQAPETSVEHSEPAIIRRYPILSSCLLVFYGKRARFYIFLNSVRSLFITLILINCNNSISVLAREDVEWFADRMIY